MSPTSDSTTDPNSFDINNISLPEFNSKDCVRSVRVMYDDAKLRGGKPQSKGYAFVEFSNHIYALAALRELNNNKLYDHVSTNSNASSTEAKGRLIVEFSVENIRKVSTHYL